MISDIIAGIDHVTAHSNEIVIVNLALGANAVLQPMTLQLTMVLEKALFLWKHQVMM